MNERQIDRSMITRRIRRLAARAAAPPWSSRPLTDADGRLRGYVWLWYLWVTAVAAFALLLCVHGWAGGMAQMPKALGGFDADSRQAMDTMMRAMDAATTGDADRDFVAAMTPHHQGAIDMAVAELRYGKDETLRRMAQEIIVEQQQEIVAMRLAADKLPPDAAAAVRLPTELCTNSAAAARPSVSHPGVDTK